MPKIYCISGLGADQRVFQFLRLPGADLVHLQWVPPAKGESLSHYAGRLLSQIDTRSPVTLLGVSFGGVIAQEIAHLIPCRRVIILSSVKSRAELPWYFPLVRFTRIHRLVPAPLLKWSNRLVADYYFSVRTAAESKLLAEIVADTDPAFLRWAIDALVRWQPGEAVPGLVHLHGTRDRIFPYGRIKDAVQVDGGGHFMIVSQAGPVSQLIRERLAD